MEELKSGPCPGGAGTRVAVVGQGPDRRSPWPGSGSHVVATTENRVSGAGYVVRALGSRIPQPVVWGLAFVGTVLSAIAAKEMSAIQPPAAVSMVQIPDPAAAAPDVKLEDAADADEAELAALNATIPVVQPVAMVA